MPSISKIFKRLNPASKIRTLQKELKDWQNLLRPMLGYMNTGHGVVAGTPYPEYPYSPETVYYIARYSDTVSTIHFALRREAFRNGVEITPSKRSDTESETTENIPVDESQRKEILDKLECANSNNQSMEDVLKEFEDDLNTFDDGYLLFLMEHIWENGDIIDSDVLETIRVDPRVIKPILNSQEIPGMNDSGYYLMFNPKKRDNIYEIPVDKASEARDRDGSKLYIAYFKHTVGDSTLYYMENEVLHLSRYRPSKGLGFSPIITMWQKVKILMGQDSYMLELYEGKRPPKGLTIFNTSNRDGFKKTWDEMLRKAKENPHMPAALATDLDVGQNQRKLVEYIDFMRSLDELQFTESRDELRKAIGGLFGVMPIFQADQSSSGGLNNEGMQITVTNRTIEDNQGLYNKKVWPIIVKRYKWNGWIIRLKPSEEQDEMAKLQRENQSLLNAQLALQVGLEAEYDEKTHEVFIKSGSLKKPEQPSFYYDENNDYKPSGGNTGSPDDDTDSQQGRPATKNVKKYDSFKDMPLGSIRVDKGMKISNHGKIVEGPDGQEYFVPHDRSGGNPFPQAPEFQGLKKSGIETIRKNIDSFKKGDDTLSRYTMKGVLDEERRKLHKDIIKSYEELSPCAHSVTRPHVIFTQEGGDKGKKIFAQKGLYEAFDRNVLKNDKGQNFLVLDIDDIKKRLPEYDGGLGDIITHRESSKLNSYLLNKFKEENINLIVIGVLFDEDRDLVDLFSDAGYEVTVL